MDFSTIDRKLASSNPAKPDPNPNNPRYLSADEFIADIRLIFSNCLLFNGPDHPVTQMGKRLEATFDKQIKNLPPPAEEVRAMCFDLVFRIVLMINFFSLSLLRRRSCQPQPHLSLPHPSLRQHHPQHRLRSRIRRLAGPRRRCPLSDVVKLRKRRVQSEKYTRRRRRIFCMLTLQRRFGRARSRSSQIPMWSS